MAFADDMARIVRNVKSKERQLYNNCVEHAFRSIRFGSAVTGAPGQPVDSGDLLKSYRVVRRGARNHTIVSDLFYAPIIEDNRRGAKLRSKVGGFHSIKLTRLGWSRIVQFETKRLNASGLRAPVVRTPMMRDSRGRFTGKAAELDING